MRLLIYLLSAVLASEVPVKDIPPPRRDNLPPDAPLEIEILSEAPEPCVRRVGKDDFVKVHFTMWILSTSEELATTRGTVGPITIKLGHRQVYAGWEEGMAGACVGETRRLILPSGKTTGDYGVLPRIPSGVTAAITVEILSIDDSDEL